MSRKYPRIGRVQLERRWQGKAKGQAPQCQVPGCSAQATHRVDVEVSWFRGDDEMCKACANHLRDPQALLAGMKATGSQHG